MMIMTLKIMEASRAMGAMEDSDGTARPTLKSLSKTNSCSSKTRKEKFLTVSKNRLTALQNSNTM